MSIHVMSRACHHFDGLVRVPHGTGAVGSDIVGIVIPSTTDSKNLEANKKLILNAKLLEGVLTTPIFIVKSIHLSCHLTFSQAFKNAFYKVVVYLGSVGAWVHLLVLPVVLYKWFKP